MKPWRMIAGLLAAVLVLLGHGAQAQTVVVGAPLDLIPWAPPAEPPAWRRFALAVPKISEGAPVIALLIDDMGEARAWTRRAIALPGPLTLSFFPHAPDLAAQIDAARAAGHELMLHMPMQPEDESEDPGPNPLILGLDTPELERRAIAMLDSFTGYVGVNNHMGSRFTQDWPAMATVLAQVRERGLLYLDSRTAGESVAERVARSLDIPTARRDIFIDNDSDAGEIAARLAELEALARERGFAVGIAHPRPQTLLALEAWLPGIVERGFVLAPISAIVGRGLDVDFAAASAEKADQ